MVLPLLANLGRTSIDILELGSSFWDIAWLTKRLTAANFDYSTQSIPEHYITQFATRLSKHLRALSSVGLASKTKTILFRTAHHTGESFNWYIPANVVEQLDSVAEEVVKGLQGLTAAKPWFAASNWERVKSEAAKSGLAQRLRLDYSGRAMLGQTRHLSKQSPHSLVCSSLCSLDS